MREPERVDLGTSWGRYRQCMDRGVPMESQKVEESRSRVIPELGYFLFWLSKLIKLAENEFLFLILIRT